MKKLSKSLIVFSLVLMIFAACFLVLPEEQAFAYTNEDDLESNEAVAQSGGYFEILDYHVDVDASAGRKAKIVEKLTLNFPELNSSHGILRDLNMANGEDYFDIDVVGAPMQLQKRDDYIRLKIGDPDYYMNGEKFIKISYTVVMPTFKENKDSFLYQVIPYFFDCPIYDFTVNMTLPTDVRSEYFLHSGTLGANVFGDRMEEDLQIAEVTLYEGNKFVIKCKEGKYLDNNQGVGIRFNFPEGTLSNVVNLEPLYIFLAGLVILAAAIVMLFVFGRDDKIVEVVRFDPPYQMPPIDMGYLIDGTIENSDVTSLFFYWAKLGAMEIHQEKKKIWFVKTGELPESCRPYEKELFDSLFLGRDVVDPTQLNEVFILKLQKVKFKVKNQYVRNMYTKNSVTISKVFMIIAILFVTVTSIIADKLKYGNMDVSIAFLGLIIGAIVYGYYSLGKYLMQKILKFKDSKKKTLYFVLYGLLGVVIAVASMFLLSFLRRFTLIKSFCMIICPIITCWIAPYIHKRTPEYNEILGEIIGFRNFILIAEKDQLEALVKENPEYYYDILPFAHVLGVSDVLKDKFKNIPLELPFWYRGSDITLFDVYMIDTLSRDITSAVASQLAETAARGVGKTVSKFGGGKSGGGFSGGGFGGGGGSSW